MQHDTAQALSQLMQIPATLGNDIFLTDLPLFSGDESKFLDWILKIKKVASLTGCKPHDLATAKSEGPVFKLLSTIPATTP